MASITCGLLIGTHLYLNLKPTHIKKSIQENVQRMDSEMQTLIERGLGEKDLEKTKTGLIVFRNDTLTFWNSNEIGPKLMKRKVELGHDTICALGSGTYFVKSFGKDGANHYLFRKINSNYQIENQYFENRTYILPSYIDTELAFQDGENGFDLYNTSGKLLTKCLLIKRPKLKPTFAYLWWMPLLALLLAGLIMAFNKPRETWKKETTRPHHIEIGITAIIFGALIGTLVYNKAMTHRENKQMRLLAENLSEKRDTNFENSYARFAEKVKTDTTLRVMLFSESNVLADVILGYSEELLFDPVMNAYTTTLTLCEPNEEISLNPEGLVMNCQTYFTEKLADNPVNNAGDSLFFIDYNTLDPNYLGIISITENNTLMRKTLYFEFYKPIAPEGFGFPQFLKDDNSERPYDYSVANYRNGILAYKYGKYIYPNFLSDQNGENKQFSNALGYKHYTLKNGEDNTLVISAPRKDFWQKTAPFAIIFLTLSIPFLLVFWLLRPKKNANRQSFRKRLQTVVLLTMAISFLPIGFISVLYMRIIYNQKTSSTQFETTRTIAVEMRNDINLDELMNTASRNVWEDLLHHYASTFFTDLNLYRLDGTLIATTRQEILELRLQAPLMNPKAYQQMHHNKALFFTHEERLGKGAYESAYIPLTDRDGNTLAYLNTPYFSSVSDLHKEIQNFVLTYINIILLLLGIALVIVLLITKRLTQPLSLIQNKLGNIKIDQKNEPIEWEGNDEIGALVKQYNQLIDELEKSAAELRRTTTESAWRGVARQVAHEIKNSLTPMRLSVQLLQRNLQNGKATPEQIQRTSNTLIEQIDALSDMASSFSTFAKLPENHPAPLDLAELVGNVVHLYDNVENITFNYDYEASANHTYNGDKTNLNSAVGNLVKNAVQAIGNKPNGKIDVTLKSSENAFVISVKDNGKGIKEEDKNKIFLPNFTTKTGGSGVGLSLTYNIVQAAGGTISFESQEGEGAKFIIELPKTN